MIIDVRQTISERKNEFEISYNNKIIYRSVLPFINVLGSLDLEKLREIKVYDENNNLKYKTSYNYIDNKLEELIPLKYLVTKSQKFNQLKFINLNDNDEISIFFEMNGVWNGCIIVKYKDMIYRCYSVEDGYIRHICIYNDDAQIGELLKPNVIVDGKDEYRIYLKDEYSYLKDALSMLALYIDRTEYNSSYLKNDSVRISKNFSYSKINKYYDPNWVKNNFDSTDYFNKINEEVLEMQKNIMKKFKSLITIIGTIFAVLIIITIILSVVLL